MEIYKEIEEFKNLRLRLERWLESSEKYFTPISNFALNSVSKLL